MFRHVDVVCVCISDHTEEVYFRAGLITAL